MELFGTAGIRGDVRTAVTPELALAVGRAAGADGDVEEFVLGRDGRTTGTGLADAMAAGLSSAGADVVRVGQVPTPTVGFASRGRRGVVITASHNPPTDNGIKLFADGQEYDDEAEAAVEARVDDDPDPLAWDEWGSTTEADLLPEYRAAVVEYARKYGAPLDGLEIAVDCGNGMASLATPQVLRELGADVRALNANVDGHFPGRESKPTAETLRDLRAFVADGGADLGIGHDGDADRIVIVDADGEVVHEDTVVAVLAEQYVRTADADAPGAVDDPEPVREEIADALADLTAPDGTLLVDSVDVREADLHTADLEVVPASTADRNVVCKDDFDADGEWLRRGSRELGDIADETRAYSLIPGRFYLNLEGREPRGAVDPNEYETVRDDLKTALEDLEGPDGRPVADRVVTKEDAFRGDHDEIAPDLVVIPNYGFDLKAGFKGADEVFGSGPRNGMHSFDNASLFVDDPGVAVEDADLFDIAPTILELMEINYERSAFDGGSLVR